MSKTKADYQKTYRTRHKAAIAARQKAYRERNRVKIAEAGRKYAETHKTAKRDCTRKYRAKNRDIVLAKRRAKRAANSHVYRAAARLYYAKNKEQIRATMNAKRLADPEPFRNLQRSWRSRNRAKVAECARVYVASRLTTGLSFKLAHYLRSRTRRAIKNGQKGGSAVRDLGCTIPALVDYIESQFLPGMSWDNWTQHGWHLDHKKPLSSFDLTDRSQFIAACHYTNLQPLWSAQNKSKGKGLLLVEATRA